MLDLAIVNGSIVTTAGVYRGTVGVSDGKIASLTAPDLEVEAKKTIDAAGKHVLPGVIDPHVHFRLVGRTFDDLCERETRSMIAGGVTTGLVFTEAPGRSYGLVLRERVAAIEDRSYCDLAIHVMIQGIDHVDEIPAIAADHGVTSFKHYFAAMGRELYPETIAVDDGVLWASFEAIGRLGPKATAMVHAEDWEVASMLTARLQAQGRKDPRAWTESKPTFVEEEAIRRAVFFAGRAGCRLFVVHVSSNAGVGIIAEARSRGQQVFAETCPHYLTINLDHPKAILARYNPSVKFPEDNAGLWRSLASGDVDCLGSDHIPIRWEDKKAPGFDDIWTARGGIPGSATILPLLLSEGVNKGRLTLPQVAEVTSAGPARIFGIDDRKGSIALGMDADLVIVDMERELEFHPELLQVDYSIFTGEQFKGWPVATVLRGEVVVNDGEILGKPGDGRYLRRTVS